MPSPDAVADAPSREGDAAPAVPPVSPPAWLFTGPTDRRLAFFTETMRAISRHSDPQQLVVDYYMRMREAFPTDAYLALSRRDLPAPCYRITRSDKWGLEFNPWKHLDQRPIYDRGLLGELIYRGEPIIVNDVARLVRDDDPAAEFFEGQQSLMAIPMFDRGQAINMVVFMRRDRGAFDPEKLPEQVWVTNLFGRATTNLVLRQQVTEANDRLHRELEAVGTIQQSLLPEKLPQVPGLKVAAFYDASEQSGGDYYDFFELPDGRLGIFVADVSGHGTPAAVLMAVVHAIAHSIEDPPFPEPPGRLLAHLNRHLCERYTRKGGTFVTAWYGVYDPTTRKLVFANAGHPAPRLKHDNAREDEKAADAGPLSGNARSLPLGIDPQEVFPDTEVTLEPGDVVVAYTDGITESRSPTREMWGTAGMDASLLGCSCEPQALIDDLIDELQRYTHNAKPADDRTIVAMKVY